MMDESDFSGWSISGTDSIEINTDVDTHRFRIVTGYTGDSQRIPTSVADAQPSNVIVTAAPSALASATIQLATSGGCSSSCC